MATRIPTDRHCRFVMLSLALALALAAAACSGPPAERPAPPTATETPAGPPIETTMLPRGLFPETNMQALIDAAMPSANLLQNAGFGEWAGALPAQWEKSPTSGTLIRKTDRQQDGQAVIEVIAEDPGGALLEQKAADGATLKPGQKYTVSAWIRVLGKADLVLARIGVNQAGEPAREEVTAPHPGDGSWHKLEVVWPVPDQLMPGLKELKFQARIMNPGTLELAGPQVVVEGRR